MVIDAANGVEAQTLRLLQVCRARNTPILTFINKMDREVRDPLDLVDEIERTLGMAAVPFTWPVGMGKRFHGVYDLRNARMRVFRPGADRLAHESDEMVADIADPAIAERFGAELVQARNEIELVQGASPEFDHAAFLAGKQTPVFFGSAINNFGVHEILDALADLAPPPEPARRDPARGVALRGQVQRRRVQDPGQHGPRPPRPHRLRARVLRAVRARHAPHGGAQRQGHPPGQRRVLPVAAARAAGIRLPRRHHRHPQPRHAAARRHAHRGRGACSSRGCPSSRRRSSSRWRSPTP